MLFIPDCVKIRCVSSFCVCCCFQPSVRIRYCYCDAVAGHQRPSLMRKTIPCHLYFHCCYCDGDGGGGDGGQTDRLVRHPNRLSIRSLRNNRLPSSCNGRNCYRPCRPLHRHQFCCLYRRSCHLIKRNIGNTQNKLLFQV